MLRIIERDTPTVEDLGPAELDRVAAAAVPPALPALEADRQDHRALPTYQGMMAEGPNERMY